MENQHRKIAGYRELSQEEIDLMNRIKASGAELLALQKELAEHLNASSHQLAAAVRDAMATPGADAPAAAAEFERFNAAEPHRWANIGRTDIQTGIMALVRAVAQPAGV